MEALEAVYPDHIHVWKAWKQERELKEKDYKPRGYWSDLKNQRSFFDALAIKLNIKQPEDWNKVAVATVVAEGGHFVQNHYGSFQHGKLQYV
jgi:hypothetical protein